MSYYDTIGLKRPPSGRWSDIKPQEISKAWKEAMRKAHPDKGGSKEEAQKVNLAYDVLSNPTTRANYHRELEGTRGGVDWTKLAEEVVTATSTSGASVIDGLDGSGFLGTIFGAVGTSVVNQYKKTAYNTLSAMAAASGHSPPPPPPLGGIKRSAPSPAAAAAAQPKVPTDAQPTFGHPLLSQRSRHCSNVGVGTSPKYFDQEQTITLEDLYNCSCKPIKISASQACVDCRATGGVRKLCVGCKGATVACTLCDSKGFVWDPICKTCDGKQLKISTNFMSIALNPGIDTRVPIQIWGVLPDPTRGLRIFLKEMEHSLYTRIAPDGRNLHLRLEISLTQALGGIKYPIRYLDGKDYIFKYDGVIHPNKVLKAEGLGMLDSASVRGYLLIEFVVLFPQTFSTAVKEQLAAICLPSATDHVVEADATATVAAPRTIELVEFQ
jgi:DnaJ-class molecular chaperone